MAAPASHPAFPRDAWPTIELKRVPNGEMGVLLEFPSSPEMVKLGVDVLGFLVEPQRALAMRKNLDDVLEVMGIGDADMGKAIVMLARRAIGFSQHAAVCEKQNRDWPGLCSCGLDGLRKEIEAL